MPPKNSALRIVSALAVLLIVASILLCGVLYQRMRAEARRHFFSPRSRCVVSAGRPIEISGELRSGALHVGNLLINGVDSQGAPLKQIPYPFDVPLAPDVHVYYFLRPPVGSLKLQNPDIAILYYGHGANKRFAAVHGLGVETSCYDVPGDMIRTLDQIARLALQAP